MGNLTTAFCRRRQMRVAMFGLDAAGKTTIPTIGFNVETCKVLNAELTVWDVGTRDKLRPLWRHYYLNTQAIVFVVDSTDRDRMDEAKQILHELLTEDELTMIPIAVALNKRDLENCMSKEELENKLDLRSIQQQRACEVFLTTAYPSAEVQSEITRLMEWVAEYPANREEGSVPKQKTDRFSEEHDV
ncbi:uncharacterized protein LOC111118205 [Crassostrea virginica]